MRTFGAQLHAYDNDVIQLFLPFADSTQPIKIQTTLPNHYRYDHSNI